MTINCGLCPNKEVVKSGSISWSDPEFDHKIN